MFCQLGNIIFEKAKSPNAISEMQDITYAEHSLMNQKNRLQPTGPGLRQLDLSLYLNINFAKVKDEIEVIRKAASDYEVLPLLWGNGKLEGNFVITNLSIDTKEMNEVGDLYAATISISLKEFISNPAQVQQQKADKKAFATGTKKSVTAKKSTGTAARPAQGKVIPVTPTSPCNSVIDIARSKLHAISLAEFKAYAEFQVGGYILQQRPAATKIAHLIRQAGQITAELIVHHADCLTKFSITQITRELNEANNAYSLQAYNPPDATPVVWKPRMATFHDYFHQKMDAFQRATAAASTAAITRKP